MLNAEMSQRNKEHGMERSISTAGSLWARDAYMHFYNYCVENGKPFMVEEIREYAERKGLAVPPSRRAWGSIVVKAKKNGWIEHVGYGQVSNPHAHRANASMWVSKVFNLDDNKLF